jgi:6-phosphogluconolactonase
MRSSPHPANGERSMPASAQLSPRVEVLADAAAVAARGAAFLIAELGTAVSARGRATLALSGGRTPLAMLQALAVANLPWDVIDVFQVDERCTPPGHEERNAVQLSRALGELARRRPATFHWMPLDALAPRIAAVRYASELVSYAGTPPIIDVVQLGLGADGHTASLFPGAVQDEVTPTVAVAPVAAGWPRLTLTLPVINGARRIVWLVTGADKRAALAGMLAGEASVVGSRVRRDALVLADSAAAG